MDMILLNILALAAHMLLVGDGACSPLSPHSVCPSCTGHP